MVSKTGSQTSHFRPQKVQFVVFLLPLGTFECSGDKFGESLGGSQAPSSFCKVSGLPRKFPEPSRKFPGDFPRSSLTVELNSNPEVPQKFPGLPRSSPDFPRSSRHFPGGQPLSLGSLTPSPDSQTFSDKNGTRAHSPKPPFY